MSVFETIGEYFEHILFALLLLTFCMWLADRFYFGKIRRQKALDALSEFDRHAPATAINQKRESLKQHHLQQPLWLEYTASFFPVILIVFVLRSFVAEPFKIPSGSMIPTLLVGDLILVSKSTYGIRLPIINKKIMNVGDPQRGDVMVFRYPKNPSQKYIKRVIGLPGDIISYQNKRLAINGKPVAIRAEGEYFDSDRVTFSEKLSEKVDNVEHFLLNDRDRPAYINAENFPEKSACNYGSSGVVCKVPAGHYFMMGDNRDNSFDSRYWGFVPEQNIVGKAFFIWMNFGNLKRIGPFH